MNGSMEAVEEQAAGSRQQAAGKRGQLAARLERMERIVADEHGATIIRLALSVASGELPAMSLAGMLSPRTGMAVIRLARDIVSARGLGDIPSDAEIEAACRADALDGPDPFDPF